MKIIQLKNTRTMYGRSPPTSLQWAEVKRKNKITDWNLTSKDNTKTIMLL